MNLEQLDDYCPPSFRHPMNADARAMFVHQMKNYTYGRERTCDAWEWFLIGWAGVEEEISDLESDEDN